MTLYTKYRPRTFSQVVGQNSIVSTLTHDVKAQSTSHAYLFSGTSGDWKDDDRTYSRAGIELSIPGRDSGRRRPVFGMCVMFRHLV